MGWREKAQNLLWRGFLPGVLWSDWLRLLRENHYAVDRPYRRRALAVTIGSVLNSLLHWPEMLRFDGSIRRVKPGPPLFVLGVMRSGTTHLFNLLAQDKRFAFPNYIQVMNPHTFLTAEWFFASLMDALAPKTRFLDNVQYGSKIPEEDEYALLAMTRCSFMLTGPFPRSGKLYNRFLTFRDAHGKDVARWKKALKFFVQKLTYKYRRPLVLKSPGHTGRIRMILDVFPDAKFVNIHRNPFDVYHSYVQMVIKFSGLVNLQGFGGDETLEDHTIRVYKDLNDAFFEERNLIPEGNYCEIGYDSLTKDPMGQMRQIYETLALPDFQVVEPRLQSYLASIADYKKNERVVQLPAELRTRLTTAWQRYFQEWNYSPEGLPKAKESPG